MNLKEEFEDLPIADAARIENDLDCFGMAFTNKRDQKLADDILTQWDKY